MYYNMQYGQIKKRQYMQNLTNWEFQGQAPIYLVKKQL